VAREAALERESRAGSARSLLLSWGASCASLILAVLVGGLPWAPDFEIIRNAAIAACLAAAVALAIGATVSGVRRKRAQRARVAALFAGLAALALVLAAAWFLAALALGGGGLAGEDLVEALEDPGRDRQILVYTFSEIPDGAVSSRVAIRESWSPFERTVLRVRGGLTGSRWKEDDLLLVFEEGVARYRHSDGEIELSPP
jgi:hypothetical protein